MIFRRHYKTVVHDDKEYLQTYSGPIDKMVEHIKTGFKYGLFHSYFENNEEHHFGFVAMRAPENKGFFITARGSNKRLIPQTDVVYVASVDFSARVLNTHSTEGKKASLNANLAAKIFDTRKDVNLIVHAHIFPGCDNGTEIDYSPGTQEDVDEVMFYFSKDQKIVELLGTSDPPQKVILLTFCYTRSWHYCSRPRYERSYGGHWRRTFVLQVPGEIRRHLQVRYQFFLSQPIILISLLGDSNLHLISCS